ncbi:MAG: transcriptional regulator, partial [Paracoccaceae bacterium]
ALWAAIENPDTAGDLTAILCVVGSVFAFLSRYAVNFWNQGLHQGATLSVDKEQHIDNAYYLPLLVCLAGFVLFFVTLVLLRTRTEIRTRRISALLARERQK